MKGRAETYEQKREAVDKILGAWMCTPTLRLGQLIDNAISSTRSPALDLDTRLFYIEDEDLVDEVTQYILKRTQ